MKLQNEIEKSQEYMLGRGGGTVQSNYWTPSFSINQQKPNPSQLTGSM